MENKYTIQNNLRFFKSAGHAAILAFLIQIQRPKIISKTRSIRNVESVLYQKKVHVSCYRVYFTSEMKI